MNFLKCRSGEQGVALRPGFGGGGPSRGWGSVDAGVSGLDSGQGRFGDSPRSRGSSQRGGAWRQGRGYFSSSLPAQIWGISGPGLPPRSIRAHFERSAARAPRAPLIGQDPRCGPHMGRKNRKGRRGPRGTSGCLRKCLKWVRNHPLSPEIRGGIGHFGSCARGLRSFPAKMVPYRRTDFRTD